MGLSLHMQLIPLRYACRHRRQNRGASTTWGSERLQCERYDSVPVRAVCNIEHEREGESEEIEFQIKWKNPQ